MWKRIDIPTPMPAGTCSVWQEWHWQLGKGDKKEPTFHIRTCMSYWSHLYPHLNSPCLHLNVSSSHSHLNVNSSHSHLNANSLHLYPNGNSSNYTQMSIVDIHTQMSRVQIQTKCQQFAFIPKCQQFIFIPNVNSSHSYPNVNSMHSYLNVNSSHSFLNVNSSLSHQCLSYSCYSPENVFHMHFLCFTTFVVLWGSIKPIKTKPNPQLDWWITCRHSSVSRRLDCPPPLFVI